MNGRLTLGFKLWTESSLGGGLRFPAPRRLFTEEERDDTTSRRHPARPGWRRVPVGRRQWSSPCLKPVTGLVSSFWPYLAAVAIPAVSTAILAYVRRPKSAAAAARRHGYLSRSELLRPPLRRPAYSDRMAYVLAEMADLAYCQFENPSFLELAGADAVDIQTSEEMAEFLGGFAAELLGRERALGKDVLRQVLESKGFSLLDVLDIADTQGFVCKRNATGTDPAYLVIAFRGTEKKVSDWLTDANCVTRSEGSGKVHTGFWRAMAENQDPSTGDTIEEKIRRIIIDEAAAVPLFITGHSLGGALALLATKLVAPDVDGACYTFGGPRVANYEYFSEVKTPVYRVVNSSDIVPRVPPGAWLEMGLMVIRGLAWALGFAPPVVSLLNKLEERLDKLNGYRHFGDLRYLSDVGEGRFERVRLLTNPPAIDRVMWMWRRIAKSALMPIRSHNMVIYRKKLEQIAGHRNAQFPNGHREPPPCGPSDVGREHAGTDGQPQVEGGSPASRHRRDAPPVRELEDRHPRPLRPREEGELGR